ncbi:hypothetical protein OG21DRAFT_1502977, partial [Imleria badia]
MHAGMRRVPAERARHAKRLGHVSGPAFPILADASNGNGTTTAGATTPSSQTPPTPTSATHSSSSALTSSSTTPSSPPALSSPTTPSTSSVASPSAPALSLSLIIPSAASTSTSPTPSTMSTPPANAAAVTNSGLSGGAIAGIIAGAAVVGAALIVFFVRKTYLRRRERKRISWNGAPGLGADILEEPKPFSDISERPASSTIATNTPQRIAPPSPFEAYGQSMYTTPVSPLAHMQPPSIPTYATPAPPPATYNNPTPVSAYPTYPVPSPYNPGNPAALAMARGATGAGISSTLSSVRAQRAPAEATVKCTFVPTLPDELSITTGERVFIVEQYDDGWDLCANVRGERGMVPRECLEHAPIDQPDVGWRNVRRASSLNPDGM